jgi:hypothetical protein
VTIPAPPNGSFAVRWKRLTAMVPFFDVRLAEDARQRLIFAMRQEEDARQSLKLCGASWTHGARLTEPRAASLPAVNVAAVWGEPGEGFFFAMSRL